MIAENETFRREFDVVLIMDKFLDCYKVESNRRTNWNYSSPGIYFITVCTTHRDKMLGKIVNNEIVLSSRGLIAHQCLVDIPKHFPDVNLLEFVVMPNHVHILLETTKPLPVVVETHHDASLTKKYQSYFHHRIAKKSTQIIPLVIKQYKSAVTKLINPKTCFFGWQSRYYDEIIEDEKRLKIIKYYIRNNAKYWIKDKLIKNYRDTSLSL